MARSSHQVSQNVDNFLSEKSSTRLHHPPGGGSSVGSLIFGGQTDQSPFAGHERRASLQRKKEETPEQNPYSKDYRRASADFTPPSAQYPAYNQQQAHHQNKPGAAPTGQHQLSSNSYASGSNQNTGNVLTERRITRIHAPPGGVSQIRFG